MPRKSKTTDQFISDARKMHGERYDYSHVHYVNNATKVKILCPIHGEFEQIPRNHLSGQGCPSCGGTVIKTTDQFISDARKVHGDRYDYSHVHYVHSKTKVKIICPIHGMFEQIPTNHLKGQDCPSCANESVAAQLTKNTDQFISDARKVHGDRYDYSHVHYVHNKAKVKIICPIHGMFEQPPNNHLSGQGCPHCKKTHEGEGFVYLLATSTRLKIGKVKNSKQANVEKRIIKIFRSQAKKAPDFIEGGMFQLCGLFKFGEEGSFVEAGHAEKAAHRMFKSSHCDDLPQFDGSTEFFDVDWRDAKDFLESIGGVKATAA